MNKEKYPFLKEFTVFELDQLRLEAKKYNDNEFLEEIMKEFKRRQYEKDKIEQSSIPCYVDCDINTNPKKDHERLDGIGKCNKFEDKIYCYCGKYKLKT